MGTVIELHAEMPESIDYTQPLTPEKLQVSELRTGAVISINNFPDYYVVTDINTKFGQATVRTFTPPDIPRYTQAQAQIFTIKSDHEVWYWGEASTILQGRAQNIAAMKVSSR